MDYRTIASRVTGLSCPIFGISWNPPEPHVKVAKRVIAFLEDRRVLYTPSQMEQPQHCVCSVLEIRRFITGELQELDENVELAETLRAMRSACRKFLDDVGTRPEILRFGAHQGHWASWRFNGAVGELRGVFGIHLARMATAYGISIEADLATILPSPVEEDEC